MGRGINKVILIGNLGKYPECGVVSSGAAFAVLSLATTDVWRDQAVGQLKERTEWHRIVLYGRLAEIAQQYLKKGSKVYIEGSLRARKWKDNSGQDRYTTEIQARNVEMLDRLSSDTPAARLVSNETVKTDITDIDDIDDIPSEEGGTAALNSDQPSPWYFSFRKSLILVLGMTLCFPAHSDVEGKVVSVTDGDTIKVLDGGNALHRVRLTGIDAPERSQPYGNASRKHLAALVAGKEVYVESTKKDRYGRTLGKVLIQPTDCPTCAKTLDANHAQIKAGMAWWYRKYGKEQPERDRVAYEESEGGARENAAGLWEESNPVPPWMYRRRLCNSN